MEPLTPRDAAPPVSAVPDRKGPRLIDSVRRAARGRHFSPRTEEAYVGWVRRFVLFHGKRHPDDMGEPEVARFLRAWPPKAASAP